MRCASLRRTDAPEGWIKKIERSREGLGRVFPSVDDDSNGRRLRQKKEKTLGPASMPKHEAQAKLADYIEDVDGAEILSLGLGLELIKDLGDAARVASQYKLPDFTGTHAIGHTRMATESDVDIRSAHPYWAYPFADVSVVHNGQLTNYWNGRRALERRGHRFMSNCDSELIAVFLADKMEQGATLKNAMTDSIDQLDGVFTYLVATADSLGMAKDVMAAKPMVLYESDDFIAMASEEVAIRSVFPHEIDTFDPYEGEVRVWHS